MRRKKVWRYYCDHCNKGGCGAVAMAKHERRCTMNPNRECGFHIDLEIINEPQVSVEDLRKVLVKEYEKVSNMTCIGDLESISMEDLENINNALLDAANGCPACALAAIRQENAARGEQIFGDGFNYKDEVEVAFKNAQERWDYEAQYDAIHEEWHR